MAIIVNAIICTYQRREAMTEWEKAQNGFLYDANYDEEIVEARKRCADLCYEFNNCRPLDINKQRELLNAIFGSIKENPVITAPFYCDYGFNIFINMRIISGIYGRRRFDVPSSFSARPTTDFAKENIFNVVNNLVDLEGMDALDLFAGTGSISFELISRGCRNVTAIEKNNAHASFIAKVAKELKTDALALIRGDVFRYLNSAPKQSFDFIFADPPYALPELPEIPALVFERDLLKNGGIFIMEHPKTNDFSSLPYFYQHRVYGSVNFSIFLKEGEKTDA